MRVVKAALTSLVIAGFFSGLDAFERAQAAETVKGSWTGEGSVGFIGNTLDGTAFAFNLHFDRFLAEDLSVGPLVQLGFTGDLTQTGVSAQAKYWLGNATVNQRLRMPLQIGIGFVHSDFEESDTSWLIPLGVGLDYRATDAVSLSASFWLNFTNLDTRTEDTNIMPALAFGVRF